MFLFLNYCIICVELTRLGELLHSMFFCWRMASLILNSKCDNEKIVASYAQIAASIVGPICDGGL